MPFPPDPVSPSEAHGLARRSSRVRFSIPPPSLASTPHEQQLSAPPSSAADSDHVAPELNVRNEAPEPPAAHTAPPRRIREKPPEWHFPVYHNNYPSDRPAGQAPTNDTSNAPRKGSDDSDATLAASDDETKDMTYSSYRHPYDIKPPTEAYDSTNPFANVDQDLSRRGREYIPGADTKDWDEELGQEATSVAQRRPGLLGNLLQLYQLDSQDSPEDGGVRTDGLRARHGPFGSPSQEKRPWGVRRIDSLVGEDDQFIDPDDPLITGARKDDAAEDEDLETRMLRAMNYKARRKERQRVKIEFNATSMANRQTFLTELAHTLMIFGAPSHRIESQLLSAARILEVDAEFIHIPGVIICSFGDSETRTTDTNFIKCSGRLSLGALHQVHQIYRQVVHDEISAKDATQLMDDLRHASPVYGSLVRCALAFAISALICPLAFGGSFVDMWIAGLGSVVLCLMQISTAAQSTLYQNVFEVSVTIVISLLARGLSSIKGQIFCYTAISSAGIVCILPGYLILTSSLELASKNVVCGSVKMVYALIYTLFLGFGLQIGSDLYLLFDRHARDDLTISISSNVNTFTLNGKYWPDNNSTMGNNTHFFHLDGPTSFTFTNILPVAHDHIVVGCYRPPEFPWYLQSFPWWTQFIIVPLFSTLSSLGNLQPVFSMDLPVMIIISCCSYAANKTANHFIFQRSDIVSAIGAFVVGLMGNIYSRKAGGTAFTVMVTGVLFLVPSGLSQAGGITAQGDGIEIGNAMVEVTIGITVGLFMSQAVVYMFGSKKNAAIFSF
ncbi:hypothetical protein EIP91_004234 [Steccherinum ochraceum]|uniref:Threonine/serine exporter-like N-terminal domain-containing protein n=1 Tax=Steccherinum ochraceum TaxID=92696 RepID=A0A4R0RPK8_9APHY|nr:hypothetical protein EIP91_004234 [Steccherinum ochraceum]